MTAASIIPAALSIHAAASTTATRWGPTTEMVRLAGASAKTLRRWYLKGLIPGPARLGHSNLRWPLDDVLAALAAASATRSQVPAVETDSAGTATPAA
jgi:predicted DNA-binding transcriptional regulator AlpA